MKDTIKASKAMTVQSEQIRHDIAKSAPSFPVVSHVFSLPVQWVPEPCRYGDHGCIHLPHSGGGSATHCRYTGGIVPTGSAPHTFEVSVNHYIDGSGGVIFHDGKDHGMIWRHPAPSRSAIDAVAGWVSRLAYLDVTTLSGRLAAGGWIKAPW